MKILAIRIKNLASLDGHTEIDFTQEPLCSSGIFAITGPTGAGKSTLLDALCLALYAKTPRYKLAENGIDIKDVKGSTIKQDDVRGILRDGTSDGFAEVDFEGIDGQHYSACWSVRRARNKTEGNLQAYEITLKNITTNQSIPGKKAELLEEIERLVGLNFEQFTRSVLLAQGDFTAFLKAGKDEKSSLLEKLTGTRIYSEISRRIFENHKEQQQKLRELNLQREGIATLTAEEFNALQEQKITLEATIKADEQQIAALSKEINWHEQLIKLHEQVEAAGTTHDEAFKSKKEAIPREQQLQQVERVQAIKPTISSLQNIQEQFVSKSKEAETLTERLSILQQQKEAQDKVIEKAINDLAVKNKEQEEAQPLLNQAKALDVQLSEKATQVTQETGECEQVRSRQLQQGKQLSQAQEKAHLLEQELIKLNKWKADNEARRPIAEHESLVLAKLEDAAAASKHLNDYSERIRSAEAQMTSGGEQAQRLEAEKKAIQESMQQTQPAYDVLLTDLSKVDIQNIEKDKSATDAIVEDIVSATAHWKLLYHAIKEKETLLRSLDDNKKELKTQIEQRTDAEKLLGIRKAERDSSLKSLERARFVAAENIEQLRSQLVPDEPCPVCGSETHPYVTDNPVLDHVLAELETSYQQAETAYGQQLTSHSSLNEACNRIKKDIATYETTIADKQTSLQDLEQTWAQFGSYEKSKNLSVEEKANWLLEALKEQKNNQQQLQEQIQLYHKQKEKSEAYKTKLVELEKQLNDIENSTKDIDRTLKSLQQQKINDAKELQKVADKLEAIKQALSAYFTSEQWYQNWQADPETFAKHITGFAFEWRTNIKKLEDNAREQSVFAEKIKGMQEQSKNIKEELESKEQKLATLELQWNDLSDKRKALFNGMPIEEIETELKNAASLVRQILDQKKQEAETLQSAITRNIAQREQLEKDTSSLLKQEIELKEKLKQWLSNYNQQHGAMLTEIELLPLLAFTQDWVEKERTSLRAIDDALMQATSILDERTKAFESHRAQRSSTRTLETLSELQIAVQEALKKNNQTAHEIDFRIKEDETNKQRIGQFLADIEKQALIVENWAKLNEVIGSADGKKFRQVAQEYTLDVLLSYANVHLEMLSKRYVLQRVPDSLGLQVVDQDMGDEVRTVYSLSGGESFLVSLALALGLASLSSSRMKVESLFIDEGFGSLDPATLNIAMDALERLHNQGRKVGVISHVQEMTERIPVQIKVRKQQSGKSEVEVSGV